MFRFQFNKLFRGFAGLLESSNATVNISNPAFDDNFIFRQFATGIALPEVGNAVRGQLGNHPNSLSKVSEGALFIGGLPLDKGIVKIKSRGTESMGVTFQNNSIQFLEKLKKIKINEIMPTIDLMGGFEGINITIPNNPASAHEAYYFTIKNEPFNQQRFIGDPLIPTQAYLLGVQINNVFPDFATIDPNSNEIIFKNYAKYPTLDVFSDFTFIVDPMVVNTWQTPATWTEQRFREIANNATNNGDIRFCFPTVYNPSFYDNKNGSYGGFINLANTRTVILEYEGQLLNNPDVRTPLIPFLKVNYVLQHIAAVVGLSNILCDSIGEFSDLCIENNYSDSVLYTEYTEDTSVFASRRYQVGYHTAVNLNNYLPAISADEFILSLCKFDLKADVEDDEVILRSKRNNYKRTSLELTPYAERIYSIDEGAKDGFILKYNTEKSDRQSTTGLGLDPKTAKAQEYVLELPWNTLPMGTKFVELDTSIRVPLSDRVGNSQMYSLSNKTDTLRLLVDRGRWSVPTGTIGGLGGSVSSYPYASSDNRDPTDTYDSHELDLRITSANGIYNRFYKYLMPYLISARTMKKTANMPVGLFFKMLHDGHFNVFFRHPKGDVSGVVKEMSVKADNKSFGYVDVTMDVLLETAI
jgi:hypothetical protein